MRRSYQYRKLERHSRKPADLLLVPMIDIFTVLVTFLLMTAVFSRTVILQLNLPASQTEFKEPPPGLQLEVMVRKNMLMVADRNTGPLHAVPNTSGGYDYDGLAQYLKFVKTKFPEKTDASILLEPETSYDTLVQVMDRVRVFEVGEGVNTVQAELFPDISIGDAPAEEPAAASGTAPAAALSSGPGGSTPGGPPGGTAAGGAGAGAAGGAAAGAPGGSAAGATGGTAPIRVTPAARPAAAERPAGGARS